ADRLAAAVAERPADEPIVQVVEEAITSAIMAATDPRSMAIADLIRCTPALKARDQLKYAKLEQKLTDALCARVGEGDEARFRMRLLSAIVVSAMRVGGERWNEGSQAGSLEKFARDVFREFWSILGDFGAQSGVSRAR